MTPHVGSKMLGPTSSPSRSVTPPLSESARSRRETRLLSSTATCAPVSPRLPSEALRTLERIYKDSTADRDLGPRRWGSWYGATLASESTSAEEHASTPSHAEVSSPQHHTTSSKSQQDASSTAMRVSGALQTSTAASPRVTGADVAGAAPKEAFASRTRSRCQRRNRSSAWGKTHALVSSHGGHSQGVSSEAMSESEAWDVVQKWRLVVDVHFDPDSHPAPVKAFASLAETLDVSAMEPSEQQRTAQASGMPLEDILVIQAQRVEALSTLTQLHSRLVHKVAHHVTRTTRALGDIEDVRVEGMVLLRLCIWTYHESRGAFATHAWIQLEGRMKAAMYGKDRVMPMPLTELALRKRIWAARASLASDPSAGRGMRQSSDSPSAATVAAVAERTGASPEDVHRVLSHEGAMAEVSPDALGSDSANGDAWEHIYAEVPIDALPRAEEDGEDDPELLSMLDVPELRGAVEDVLNRIPRVHADVLACRYGLRGQKLMNYSETAAWLGFQSKSLVNYHQNKAVKSFLNMMSYMHKGRLAGLAEA